MQEILNDPAIKVVKARYYPAPERWEIQKGSPVRKLALKTDKAGNEYEDLVDTNIPRPVWVEAIIRNIADGRVVYEVGFESPDRSVVKMKVGSAVLSGTSASREAKEMIVKGAPVNTINFKTFVELLAEYNKYTDGLKLQRGVDQFGWFGRGMTFVLADAMGEDKELLQIQNPALLKHFRPKGEAKVWFDMFREKILAKHDASALFACSLALSSVLKGVLKADFEFIPALLIYGESAKGKTTLQQLIASMIGGAGLQSKDQGIMHSFNTTLNALQSRMTSLGPVPCIVDEKSIENETQGRKMILDQILYTINTGVKDRLDSNSRVVDEQRKIECSIILSGESSEDLSGNTGKQYRLVQQRWTGFKAETDGSLASSIKNTVAHHSGHFFPVFIDYLINTKEHLEVQYEECEAHAVKILKEAGVPDFSIVRMTPNLARTRLSCKIILACSGVDIDTARECLAEFDKKAVSIYGSNKIRPEGERIPEKIAEGIAANINRFSYPVSNCDKSMKRKYIDPQNGEIWGRVFDDNCIGVYPRYLSNLVNAEFSAAQIREVLKSIGGVKKVVKVMGMPSRMWLFRLPEGVEL